MRQVGYGLFRFFYFFIYILGLTIGAVFSLKLRRFWSQRLKRSQYSKHSKNLSNSENLIWIHCSSGEFEYAKPVLKALKAKSETDINTLVTYFSPTYAQQVLSSPHVDYAEPLPLDLPGPLQSLIKTYKPKELWIARTDLWPEVLHQCHLAQIPVILFSASKSAKSGFSQWLARQSRWLYNQLHKIYVVSEADKNVFQALGVRTPIEVQGDTRYDQVLDRLEQARDLPLLRHSQPFTSPVLVAGSTWSEDEVELLEATTDFLKSSRLRLILAPHEPTQKHIENLKQQFKSLNIAFDVWSETDVWSKPVLLVDKIGILAEIYTYGDLAFVGGSFKSKVHSVMEPLAAGCPTLVGPKHANNREALEFKKIGAVISCNSSDELQASLETLITSTKLDEQKSIIHQAIRSRTGSTRALLKDRIKSS